MASGAKKKTTMAKLMRENKLRERRLDKKAKKDARKLSPVDQPAWDAPPVESIEDEMLVETDEQQADLETVAGASTGA